MSENAPHRTCPVGYILRLDEATFPGAEISRRASGETPTACPRCGRLFPLAPGESEDVPTVVVHCNRPDEHGDVGEHWYEAGPIRVTWNITGDETWMAGPQVPPSDGEQARHLSPPEDDRT